MNNERERLLRDKSAASQLLIWARRRNEGSSEATALARLGREWRRITEIASSLTGRQLEALDGELAHWKWRLRIAPKQWGGKPLSPALRIARVFVGDDLHVGVSRIVKSPQMQWIRSLTLANDSKSDSVRYDASFLAEAISHSEHLSSLEELNLSRNYIGTNGAMMLANSKLLSSLRTLNLSSCDLRDDGLRHIVESEFLSGLISLDLSINGIGPNGAHSIRSFSKLDQLKRLNLTNNHPMIQGAESIANAPSLINLQCLQLDGCDLRSSGTIEIAESPYLHNLKSLFLRRNGIGDQRGKAMEAVSNSEGIDGLKCLMLGENYMTGVEVRHLVGSGSLHRLEILDLGNSNIRDDGALRIANSEGLGSLQRLRLRSSNIHHKGASVLVRSTRLSNLRYLNLTGNNITGIIPELKRISTEKGVILRTGAAA